ncbi:MAG TPA: nucleotide exchange factor GrpE [Saprospiraceae bacterium]|nr:nucleotide exchange factor GrpE [Saprospiraceae bacterium]
MKDDKELMEDEVTTSQIENEVRETNNSSSESEEQGIGGQDPISELQGQVAEYKDKYLRLFAEFDNYKKRTSREILDIRATASKEMMVALLSVVDDFKRAKKASDSGAESEKFSEGVTLVFQKLISVLESKGLKAMETNGEVFNAEFHEAITEIPAATEDMKGKIIDTVESGYTLNEKIIRYPKVVVGK